MRCVCQRLKKLRKLLHNNMYCKSPYTGIVINPTGNIGVCCSAPNSLSLQHISSVDNLETFFQQDMILNELRLDNQQAIDWVCKSCITSELDNQRSRRISYNKHTFTNDQTYLKYLELTTSNICNQSCSTCSSFYSSKWVEEDQHLSEIFTDRIPHKISKLTKEDINKIVQIIPQLDYLVLKGGEPFADKNNIEILEAVQQINPKCHVNIVSNFHHIPDKVMRTCSKIQNLKISASVDGIGDLYRWIRSTDFEQTVNTINRFYNITGHAVDILTTISLFNYFNLMDLLNYFDGKPYVRKLTVNKITYTPKYISVYSLPENLIEAGKDKFTVKYNSTVFKSKVERYNCMLEVKPKYITTNLQDVKQWVSHVNFMRGFNIEDLVPELKEIMTSAQT